MGTTIEFPTASGAKASGYLATGPAGAPGVIVIQEWWGVVPQIEATCDRFAATGFAALAPDLYDGTKVPVTEPDAAAAAMMDMKVADAAADLSGAVDELAARTGRAAVGVIGYCMGGGLALMLAARRPDAVAAVIPCYGVHPWAEGQPDYKKIAAATQIHCAALDGSFPPSAAESLAARLRSLGKEAELYVYDDVDHAFANDDRPEVYNAGAAALLFERATAFLDTHLR